MNRQSNRIEGKVLIAGKASGPAMVLDDRLSFWGGFDPANGEIIDVHHPQYGELVGGSVLCIAQSRGSAGTPGGIAETLRNGSGPRAFVLADRDVNISVGTLVANRLYDLEVPVLEVSLSMMAQIQSGDQLTIDRQGVILVGA
jgi:predicted aconitase with swiveling domain